MPKKIEKLEDLQQDSENANDGTARGLSAVEESLQHYGGGRSILADRDGIILAGNKTHERAVDLGFKARIVETTGNELVVVVRKDLSLKDDPAKARALAYADNRASELGLKWNPERIQADLNEGLTFPPVFFTEEEIDAILNPPQPAQAKKEGKTHPDAVPEEKPTTIQVGDIFALGPHRVMCGDSTNPQHLEALMAGEKAKLLFTDPPYGVDYDGGVAKRTEKLKNDHKGTNIYQEFVPLLKAFTEPKAAMYLFYAGSTELEVFPHLRDAQIEIRTCMIWLKNMAQFGALSAQYKLKHEHFVYCHHAGQSPRWYGPANEVSVWEADRSTKNEFHPTQKPVELARRAMTNSSQPGDVVMDLFGGSGSTLIACEQNDRICRMMELSPKHVATIIERYEKFTETIAVKL